MKERRERWPKLIYRERLKMLIEREGVD